MTCELRPLRLWKQSTDVVSVEAVWERRNTNVMKTNTALFTMRVLSWQWKIKQEKEPLPSQVVYLVWSPPNSKRCPRATSRHFFYKFCNNPANRQENGCYQIDQHWKSYFVVVTFKFHIQYCSCVEKPKGKWNELPGVKVKYLTHTNALIAALNKANQSLYVFECICRGKKLKNTDKHINQGVNSKMQTIQTQEKKFKSLLIQRQ